MTQPFLWAHRGASRRAPENTMAAFAAAYAAGADGLELDIHLSHDNVPVVIHDETLDRTTNGCGPVNRICWSQLQQLDAGRWFAAEFAGEQVPKLQAVLESYSGLLRLNLELKEYRAGLAVLDLLRDYPEAEVVLSSFNYELLLELRALDNNVLLAVLFADGNWRLAMRLADQIRACSFHPLASKVNRPMVAACQRAGLPVYVWTVDDIGMARSLLRSGVAGFFTNDPENLKVAEL